MLKYIALPGFLTAFFAFILWRSWDPWQVQKELVGHKHRAHVIAFSPSGRYLGTGAADDKVRFWDVRSGVLLGMIDAQSAPGNGVIFSPDESLVCTHSGTDTALRIWKFPELREAGTFAGHSKAIVATAFSPDGKYLASASRDHTVRVWDVHAAQLRFRVDLDDWVLSILFLGDGTRIAVGDRRYQYTEIWDIESQVKLLTLVGSVRSITNDGSRILTEAFVQDTRSTNVLIFDAGSGKKLGVLSNAGAWASFSPDARRIISTSSDSGTTRVYSAQTFRHLATLHLGIGFSSYEVKNFPDVAYVSVFTPDSTRIVSMGPDIGLKVWRSRDWSLVQEIAVEDITAFRVSSDGQHIALLNRTATPVLMSLNRPDAWWGVALLPELWLTVVMSVVLGIGTLRYIKSTGARYEGPRDQAPEQ